MGGELQPDKPNVSRVDFLRSVLAGLSDDMDLATTPQVAPGPDGVRLEYMGSKAEWRAAFQPAAEPTTMYATVNGLRVRALPSTTAAILTVLALGEAVGVVETANGWARVVAPKAGFVSAQYLSLTDPN
jgi:hypothetical protein